jgi:two-component system, OmpR family, manganese sensing sensor histidine kinase
VPLDALLIDVIEEQRTAATQKGLFLSLRIVEPKLEAKNQAEEDIFTIEGDWDHLSRLFTNLIANGIEHTNNSEKTTEASVEVELKLIKSLPKTRRVRETNQLALQVKVKDNGKGIAESDLPHIFDRFYRADPARSNQREINTPTGAGLGLAIAKAIVENHHGQITVASIPQQGTTFTVILPQIDLSISKSD